MTTRWFVEPKRPAWVRESPNAHWYAVGGVCMGAFMIQLDASIVTLTLHAMQVSFDEPLGAVQWVSLSYVLTLAALVTPIGRLSDAVGRKVVYLGGFVVFTLGSLACGFAESLPMLIVFRIVQAVGAAAIATNSVAVVTASMPKAKLRAGLAVQSSVQALGLAIGPLAGGVLVSSFGWRSVFWVNVPIGIAAVVVGVLFLPRTRSLVKDRHVDWSGIALLATATTMLLLAMSGVSGLRLPVALVLIMFSLAIIAAPMFWWREKVAVNPLVDLQLLRTPAVSLGLFGAFLSYLLLYAPLVLVPQLLIPMGLDEGAVGPMLSALPAGFVLAALVGDNVLLRGRSNRTRSLTGTGLATAALLLMLFRPIDPAWIVPLLAMLGFGLGLFIPANNAAVMSNAPESATSTASGLLSMVRNVGTALGVAFVTLALHLTNHDSRFPADTLARRASVVDGGRLALAVLIVFAVMGSVVAVVNRVQRPAP